MADFVITLNAVAAGPIYPSSFVKGDVGSTTNITGPTVPIQDLGVVGATGGTSTEVVLGIAGRYQQTLPVSGAQSAQPYEGTTGDNIMIFPAGSICLLTCGASGSWSPWAFLKSDSNGYGIPAVSGDVCGALSLTAVGASGQLGRVLVLPPGTKKP